MKSILLLFFVLSTGFVYESFAQMPSPMPAQPERIRKFGSSLKRYETKGRREPQEKEKTNELDDVVQVQTDLVVNDILVSNQKGNVIVGLQKNDFQVIEDGIPQKIEMFSVSESSSVSRSIVLILDYGVPQGPYLQKSIESAKVLVDKMGPQDEAAIATNDLKLRLNFTTDKDLVKRTLDSLKTEWGWNIEFNTLLAVLNEMFDQKNRQRIVIFQGDGGQVIWLRPDKDSPYPVSHSTLDRSGLRYTRQRDLPKFGFSEVREAIEKSRATIYSIITGVRFVGVSKEEQLARARQSIMERNKFFKWNKEGDMQTIVKYYQFAETERNIAGQTAMFKVAELSGGFADFIEKPEDAENVYSNIFTVIKNRYIIGYYPANKNRDGKRRQVSIQVRNHPEYVVTGRKAYSLSQ